MHENFSLSLQVRAKRVVITAARIKLHLVVKRSARRGLCAARFHLSRPFPTQDSAFSNLTTPTSFHREATEQQFIRMREAKDKKRERSLTYDEMGSLWGGQQWQWAEVLPRVNIYIRGFRYRYGAAVYGNARSSVQSVIKLLKYPHPPPWLQPIRQGSPRRSVPLRAPLRACPTL